MEHHQANQRQHLPGGHLHHQFHRSARERVDRQRSSGVNTAVGSAPFYYYTASSSGGRNGDLELMETFDSDNESGPVVNATFYRDYEGSYAPSAQCRL